MYFFNPETLQYKIKQTVYWKEGEECYQGLVVNINYYGLNVIKENREEVFVSFEKILKK